VARIALVSVLGLSALLFGAAIRTLRSGRPEVLKVLTATERAGRALSFSSSVMVATS
jgi:hypothetical protein